MAALGEIEPMPFCSIFSDTQAEPAGVYVWLDWLEKQLPFPVYRVTAGNIMEDALRVRQRKDGNGAWVPSGVPHYSVNADGSLGHGPRQCTGDFKLNPLLKEQRKLVESQLPEWKRAHKLELKELSLYHKKLRAWKRGRKAEKLAPIDFANGFSPTVLCPAFPEDAWHDCQSDPLVISLIGISHDEAMRRKPALRPWILNTYPLVDRQITRKDCLAWMAAQSFPTPPRSACVMCPYHSDEEWNRLKTEEPQEFQRAVDFEKEYQAAKAQTVSRKGFVPYLHGSRKSLGEINFAVAPKSKDEGDLFANDCIGMCGV